MNGHGPEMIGILTAEEILEIEAEEAYWIQMQMQEKGESNDREEGNKG
jgi:hypothetical protein